MSQWDINPLHLFLKDGNLYHIQSFLEIKSATKYNTLHKVKPEKPSKQKFFQKTHPHFQG